MANMEENEKVVDIHDMFSQDALDVLKFSDEEIEEIEYAGAFSKAADYAPEPGKGYENFCKEFDKTFKGVDPDEFMKRWMDLPKTNPKLFEQAMAMSIIFDEVEEVPPPKTEKLSMSDIKNQQNTKVDDAYMANMVKFLQSMPRDYDPNKNKN